MAERERFGYDMNNDQRISFGERVRDMFDGGGPGRSGPTFEGGGIISSIGNAMGGPAAFGGGDRSADSRGATIGRMLGGMMFGPLGMIGGGILGNMIGRDRGSQQAPMASEMPAQRPSAAMVARSPASSIVPMQRPFAPTDAAMPVMPTQPTLPPVLEMPTAVADFVQLYGGMPAIQAAYTPPLPGAVPMSQPPMLPGTDPLSPPLVGYMPRASMPVDPMVDPRNMVSLPIDRATGRPIAMMPPRVQ